MLQKKIRYLLLLLLILNFRGVSQDYFWQKIPAVTDKYLRDLTIADSINYWASGDSGVIIHSSDGGKSWDLQNSGINSNIVDICFVNKYIGWAISWRSTSLPFGTILLKTTDGGINWTASDYPESNIFFIKMLFTDSLNGWLAGEHAIVARTTDGGKEWKNSTIIQSPFSTLPILDLKIFSPNLIIACGGFMDIAGIIWKSIDGGLTFKASLVGPEPIQKIEFIDSLNWIGVGGDYEYGSSTVISSDGGETWTYTSLNFFGIPPTLALQTKSRLWSSLGFDPFFLFSNDSGKTWIMIPAPDSSGIDDIKFIDSTKAIAVGRKGAVLYFTKDSISTGLINKNMIYNNNGKVAIFPNPFNPMTYLSLNIDNESYFEIKFYDILGKEIYESYKGLLKKGTYSFKFDGTGFSSGIYFYHVKINEQNIFGKMNLIK